MKNFIVYEKSSGKVIASGTSFKPESNKDSRHDVLITDSVLDIYGIYVIDGAVVKLPEKPSGYYIFNYQTKSWDQDKDSCAADVLKYRARKLAESDWTQLPDVPLATKTAWAAYRQALRDITAQAGYPMTVVWPDPPSN